MEPQVTSELSIANAQPNAQGNPTAAEHPVVVALAGGEHDADALALARVMQTAVGRDLLLAHVIPPPPLGRGVTGYAIAARREGRELLSRAVEQSAPGSQARLLETWPAAFALSQLAEDHSASMLVLGSTHQGLAGSVVPGGTASHVVRRARYPIAVAPTGYARTSSTPISAIGVAYDGTTASDQALAAAIPAASKLGVPLRLYHAIYKLSDDRSWDRYRKTMHQAAQRVLDRGLRQVPDHIVRTSLVLEGDPAGVIADTASDEHVGLLYVGSRGYGPLREAVAAGVSGWVLHVARCPVVIVARR